MGVHSGASELNWRWWLCELSEVVVVVSEVVVVVSEVVVGVGGGGCGVGGGGWCRRCWWCRLG